MPDDGNSLKLMVLAASVVLAAGAAHLTSDEDTSSAEEGSCLPEGGLGCDGDTILVCKAGNATPAGTCPGGCTTEAGVTRCRTDEGRLVAPKGAACRPGMGLCALGANELLVCRNGRLATGATCPGSCTDEGESGGLYCLDEAGSMRFAAGFACPQFQKPRAFACGGDGKTLLRCEDGLLVRHDVACAECLQSRTGEFTCVGDDGQPRDPGGGGPMTRDAFSKPPAEAQ